MEKIITYSFGIVCCSVCADKTASVEEITKFVNESNPTNIDTEWALAGEPFHDGASNPHECEHDSDRLHYLFNC